MKLIQIQYFCGIVEQGGFIAASRKLNIAQPALSRQISNLEAEIGSKLFFRGPGGTKITEAGHKFYRHAREILEKIEGAKADMRDDSGRISGEVSIALPVGMASRLAAEILQAIERDFPDLLVRIEDGLGYQAGQAVDAGKVDFGIIANVGSLQNVTLDPVLEENLFLFQKRGQEEPNTSDIELTELQNLAFIMPNRQVHVRRNLENTLIKIGVTLNVRYEQQSLLTIRSMVQAGIGATVMNWPSMSDLWYSGAVNARRIINPSLSRTVCLATPNNRPLTKAAAAAYDVVRKVMILEVIAGNWRGAQVVSKPGE